MMKILSAMLLSLLLTPLAHAQYYDAETGLTYNFYRDYDSGTGRYVESDPIGLEGGSFSTYAYANGNPVSLIDPDGRGAVGSAVGGWIAGGIAGTLGIETGPLDIPITAAARAAGSALGNAIEESCKANKPCNPPEGTRCWVKGTGKAHAGHIEHWDIYEMQRRRSDNVCFWAYLGGKIGIGVLVTPPPPSMLPCSTYSNFTGRPPHAPR